MVIMFILSYFSQIGDIQLLLLASSKESKKMSLLGFVITGIIFLSVFDAKFTECICGCKCEEKVEVCKGDSVVLKPSAIRITDTIKSVKLIRSRTECQGTIKGNSPLIKLSNIGENDTGLYRFRGRGFDGGGPKIYCIQLKITCERLVVPSGSSVNLTCKVKNIDKLKEWRINGSSANSTSSRTLTLSQLNKSHSGNYTCIASKKDTSVTGIGQWKHYRFVLKVYEPQLIATTKSQKKHTSRFTLPTVVSVPTSITRNVTTPGFTTNKDTTKDEVTVRLYMINPIIDFFQSFLCVPPAIHFS